ncbi:MAG: signal peptidase I [Pseudomonadota bacterium]
MANQPAEKQVTVKKRRWWQALLSILAGAGYLYVGRPKRYCFWLLFNGLLVVLLFVGPSRLMSKPSVLIAILLLALVVNAAMIIDVIRLAIRQPGYQLQWFNRWWVYCASFVVWTVINSVTDIAGPEVLAVRTYSLPSSSNVPTMLAGDYITGDPSAYISRDPQRGDVVVFKLPNDNKTDYVKRVIGLPGDRIQMVDSVLYINGVAVPRKDVGIHQEKSAPKARIFEETLPNGVSYSTLDIYRGQADNTQEYEVPPGHYFVMGDNRDNSTDSRFLNEVGYVPRKNIYVKIGGVIYSPDWSRIGMEVK